MAPAPAPIPVAAPAPAAPLITGPAREVRLVAVTPVAAYLATGDPDLPALCLATRAAVRVPCALVLDAHSAPFAGWRVGATGVVGGGGVRLAGRWWPVSRWWRPARPAPVLAGEWLGAAADELARHALAGPDPDTKAATGRLAAALRAGADPEAAVRGLLGRGPGLTPAGDDVLAGALVTLRALRAPAADAVADAVTGHACARTTVVSAALLAHAARGECVAALAGLLGAVGRGETGPGLAGAAAAVTALGHTSGAALVAGVVVALGAR